MSAPLPIRDGVSPSCVVLPPGPWPTMAAFLVAHFPGVSAQTWAQRITAGEVVDALGQAVTQQRAYQSQTKLYYYRLPEQPEPQVPFEETVLYQDAHLVVADKPHFLPVTPSGNYLQETLLVRLRRKLGLDDLTPLHRIDLDTAGLVLFSVQVGSRAAYHRLFAQRAVYKSYRAVVPWPAGYALPGVRQSRLQESAHFMQMQEVDGVPNSETHLRLLHAGNGLATLALQPVTGRKHQLRVHCAALGLPILHDGIYPVLTPQGSNDYSRPLQLLAQSVAFVDPVTGQARTFASQRRLLFDASPDSMPAAGAGPAIMPP
ncbi:MAG: pseudouridine synthase [Burkholderiaceae bacterium]